MTGGAEGKEIELVAGKEAGPVDIVMSSPGAYSVSGLVADAPQVARELIPEHTEATIFALPKTGSRGPRGVAPIGPRGEFKTAALDRGTYYLYAWAMDGFRYWRSEVVEEQLDHDMSELRLRMAPVWPLAGSLQGGDSASRYTVTLQPVQFDGAQMPVRTDPDATGGFRFDPPLPGRYRVEVNPMPAGDYLMMDVDGSGVTDGVVDVRAAGAQRLRLMLRPHAAAVSGKVVGRGPGPLSYWIYAVRAGAELDTAWGRPYSGTNYHVGNLSPGKYKLLLVDPAHGTWNGSDTARLKDFADLFTEIEVKEGERASLDLKALTWEMMDARAKH